MSITAVPLPHQRGWQRWVFGRNPKLTLIRTGTFLITTLVLFSFVLTPVRVRGISMEPTYRDGRFNMVNKLAFRRNGPRRGDVVAIPLQGRKALLLKRVVGLPGEEIAFRDGILQINGEPIAEPYVKLKPWPWREGPLVLGADEYYVVGDNREMPQTLHQHGRVHRRDIMGKILF